MRAGSRSLLLLGTPPNIFVLQALEERPCSLAELQGRGGSPGSTLRARLRDLISAGAIIPRDRDFPSGASGYELTVAGEELLLVAEALECWLEESPGASRPFGGEGAKAAIKALADGWSATLLRELAVKPLSITDLDDSIESFNYPALGRRIAAMRLAGQVGPAVANGRETLYAVTPWLRRGIAPLLAAIHWERRHLADDCAPVSGIDVETIFLLAMPLLELDGESVGSCRLAVEFPKGHAPRLAGVLVELGAGSVPSCAPRLDGRVDAWASGSVGAWLRALIDSDLASLELGGDGRFARAVVDGLHRELFVQSQREAEVQLLG
jgi:DNA-binding HxlR family transcriptional regulator